MRHLGGILMKIGVEPSGTLRVTAAMAALPAYMRTVTVAGWLRRTTARACQPR